MKITYEDAVKCYEDFRKGQSLSTEYELEISGELNRPSALEAVRVLEDGIQLEQRATFVRKLLMGNTVTLRLKDEVVCTFLVNEGFQWFAVDALNKQPTALQFILSTVYGLFLKNCVPLLNG